MVPVICFDAWNPCRCAPLAWVSSQTAEPPSSDVSGAESVGGLDGGICAAYSVL